MNTTPDLFLYGEQEKSYFGISVSCAGDVNKDEFDDVIVGAYKFDFYGSDTLEDIGRAYIFYGGESMNNNPDLVITGKKKGERFGRAVSSAGDVNKDGYDDVIIGAYSFDSLTQINLGRAYIFLGGASMDTIADVVMTGELSSSYFGFSVSGAGDVNHDNYDDVIVGAYGYNYGDTAIGAEAGKSYIFLGGNPMDNLADFVLFPQDTVSSNSQFGFSVSGAGKVNGDNYDDLIVGSNGDDDAAENAGKASLILGGTSVSSFADDTLLGEGSNDQLGHSVSSAGDFNHDFYDDIIVGAWGNNSYTGKAYLYGFSITGDQIAPAPIRELKVTSYSDSSITLSWKSTGDDGDTGTATSYDLRYSTVEVGTDTLSWWNSADTASTEPSPSPPGNIDSCTISGLSLDSSYFFLIKASDEVPNPSGFSNIGFYGVFGDADHDQAITLGDVIFLANYLLKSGEKPQPLARADADGDCRVDLSDCIYVANYILKGGSKPLPGCS